MMLSGLQKVTWFLWTKTAISWSGSVVRISWPQRLSDVCQVLSWCRVTVSMFDHVLSTFLVKYHLCDTGNIRECIPTSLRTILSQSLSRLGLQQILRGDDMMTQKVAW